MSELFLILALVLSAPSAGRGPLKSAPQAKTTVVVLKTEKGDIEIEVDTTRAPVTSSNFLKYVDGGLYDWGQFHRAVRPDTETRKDYPIQVIQAGRARGQTGFPAIPIERTSVTGLRHTDGTVSMARDTADTATSDIFICIGDQPELDFGGRRNADGQGFAAFGRVVAGMDVVKAIQAAPVAATAQTLTPPIRILKAVRKTG